MAKSDEERITRASEGEEFTMGKDPYVHTVAPSCGADRGQWVCVTHEESFTNQLQKDFHVTRGEHVLAWCCLEHGAEVP